MARRRPEVIVLAGPNGAGKSTCADELLPDAFDLRNYVNADTIAHGLAAFAPQTVAVQAGRIMLSRIRQLAMQHEDFAFETTLSGVRYAKLLRDLVTDGFRINIIYLWLRSVELSVSRVSSRVEAGGHDISTAVLHRRFLRSATNFWNLYRPLADRWLVCDNSGARLKVVATGFKHRTLRIREEKLFHAFKKQCKRRHESA